MPGKYKREVADMQLDVCDLSETHWTQFVGVTTENMC